MMSGGESDSGSDTNSDDVSTEDISTTTGNSCSVTSSGTGISRRHELRRRDVIEQETEQFVEDMNKEHAYSFMARCVACPISQPLFNNELMEPRDKRLNCESMEQVAFNCKTQLEMKFPVPPGKPGRDNRWNTELYIRKRYVTPDKDYDPQDLAILWLYCQITPTNGGGTTTGKTSDWDISSLGHAYRLVNDSPGGRVNGFTLESLTSITKSFIDNFCKQEHKDNKIKDEVCDVVFRGIQFTTAPTRELSMDYYLELLQKLLQVGTQRHKLIYNHSRLNSLEAQIVRLRAEIDDRDKAMLLNQRRSSVDSYMNEEDADKALKEEEENLRLFKERVQAGSTGTTKYPSPHHTPKSSRAHGAIRSLSGTMERPTAAALSDNQFRVKLSIWQVEVLQGREHHTSSEFNCTAKCSGSNKKKSSDIKLLGKDGKIQFENEYNFTTRRPAPVLSVKLKKLKDGLYFGTRKPIASKRIKLNIRHKSGQMPWKRELMKAETFHHDDVSVLLEYKYEVTFSEKIKMLGWLTVSAKSGHWKGERKSFFVLYKGTGLEDHGLQEIGKDGSVIRIIHTLTDYDVMNWTNDNQGEREQLDELYGFTLFQEGEEIYFYAPTNDEKEKWVRQIFLLTKQTHETDDRSRSSSSTQPEGSDALGGSDGRCFPTTDITAVQGRHSKYFTEITNSMIHLNMDLERPVADGRLHKAHEALLLEYKDRYDISNGLYYTTMLDCLTRKVEDGYYVDYQHLLQIMEQISRATLRKSQHDIKEKSMERLFEYIKLSMELIFLKFPYNLRENQLFGYSLLLQQLSKDLNKENEVGELGMLMIKVIEKSMVHEYEKNIAPRHLAEMGLEKFKFKGLSQEMQSKVLCNLMNITYKFLMFIDNFITFFCGNLMSEYKDISETQIRELCETLFGLYSHDLAELVGYLPACEQVFDLYGILNKFCTNVPYLDFGVFHKESLHKAFLVHVLTHIEQEANQIMAQTDEYLYKETWVISEQKQNSNDDYQCKSVRLLNQQLSSFKAYIDNLQWPNPDFRTMFAEMAEEKTVQIKLKYGNFIREQITIQVKRDRGISELSLIMFNSLLALYSSVPANLDPAEDLDTVVQGTLEVLASSLVKYLKKILSDWSGPFLLAAVNCHLLGIKNKLFRVKEFIIIIRGKANWVIKSIHPVFSDTYLNETYKTLLSHILLWLEEVNENKRCYPALVYVTRELVDKLRDIFTTSQHHIVAQAPPNIQAYTNIENILNTKDMELIMQNKDQLQDDIRSMLTE
ncbi:uncharacterized protein LOC134822664 isoform X2 [Bolinopsis microptera]|uniref:uncharacterized protein LOC134822664 isoform X2 n=1 Tax=Bolinopsis microptera TaxID=2820187 RepID=UPI00307A33FB